MGSFIVKAEDLITQAKVNVTGASVNVAAGSASFPAGGYVEVVYDRSTANGELTAATRITGLKVYSSYSDYLNGSTLYNYASAGGGGAQIGGNPANMGDTWINVNASGLTSTNSSAPALGNVFLSPGSGVAGKVGTYSAPRKFDVDLNRDGRIGGAPERGNNQYFTGYSGHTYICFGSGTMVMTLAGARPVECLGIGDRVITRDDGAQAIRWVGRRRLVTGQDFAAEHQPIVVRTGALGDGLPERDLVVSPNHRVLLTGPRAQALYGAPEVLAAARHLLHMPGIERQRVHEVTYHHVLFDRHQVILSDGAWTESFQPGQVGLGTVDEAARDEILALFPELAAPDAKGLPAARTMLRRHEARLFA